MEGCQTRDAGNGNVKMEVHRPCSSIEFSFAFGSSSNHLHFKTYSLQFSSFFIPISLSLTKYGDHTTKRWSEKAFLEDITLSDVCCSAGSPLCTDVCASVCDCSFMASVSWWSAVGFVCSVAEGYSKLHKMQRAQQKTPAFLAEVMLQTLSVCMRRKGGSGEGGRRLVSETLQSGAGLFTDVFGLRR